MAVSPTCVIFFVLGVGSLLPWNFFMAGTPYFLGKLTPNSSSATTEIKQNGTVTYSTGSSFPNTCLLISQLAMIICSLLNSVTYKWIPEKIRVVGPMAVTICMFCLTAVLVPHQINETIFLVVTLITIAVINGMAAIIYGGLFAVAARYHYTGMTAFLTGQAAAGLLSGLVTIAANVWGDGGDWQYITFFSIPCVTTLVCVVCYLKLPTIPHEEPVSTQEPSQFVCFVEELDMSACDILKKIWLWAINIVLIFTVTIALFPVILMHLKPSEFLVDNVGVYMPMMTFVVFSCGDVLGRIILFRVQWPRYRDSTLLTGLVCGRLLFIPLILLAVAGNWITCDTMRGLVILLLGISNGYLSGLVMNYSQLCTHAKFGEMIGTFMSFFLNLGLVLGSVVSFGLNKIFIQ